MARLVTLFLLAMILAAAGPAAADGYVAVDTGNPAFQPNTVFGPQEDYHATILAAVRERYNLAEVIRGEPDEFRRILRLRNWLHKHVVVDKKKSAAPHFDALAILEQGPAGGSYSCGHFETAQSAVLGAMGFVTRCIISGPDGEDPKLTGTHGSNEVWCNELGKWVMLDAEWNSHFEKDGVPLSALELRGAYLADGGVGVKRVVGLEREAAPKSRDDQWGLSPKAYAFFSWRWQTDRLSIYPEKISSDEVVYDDEFFRANTWYRGGRKHWAYDGGAFRRVAEREDLEWTPGVLAVETRIEGDAARVELNSDTPNLAGYQIRPEGGEWEPAAPAFTLKLTAERHEWRLRSLNAAGVAGHEYRLVIEKR